MSTRNDAASQPLDPPQPAHEDRKDNKDGQTLKAALAGHALAPGDTAAPYRGEDTEKIERKADAGVAGSDKAGS